FLLDGISFDKSIILTILFFTIAMHINEGFGFLIIFYLREFFFRGMISLTSGYRIFQNGCWIE
ncbi:hypothetical protein, partial [Raoultella ornithinolytica]|uniref:hypothetical protein n=1 Tax=Raoultella ornithinolytica TaxID=54291 RepID=UPI001F1FCB37